MYFELLRINEVDKFIERDDTIIVDLRSEEEFQQGHIKRAINVPYEIGDNIAVYVQGYRYVLLYCQKGSASMMAARDLHGVNAVVYSLSNGLHSYYGKLVRS